MNFHTIPLNDHNIHVASDQCHCNPLQDPISNTVYIHHAFDGREASERAGFPIEGKGWCCIGEFTETKEKQMYDQVNYMVFKKPHGSKVWTRVSEAEMSGVASANLFGKKETSEYVANKMADVHSETHSYTIFKCTHVGFTLECGGGRID